MLAGLALSAALGSKAEFDAKEWDAFGVHSLHMDHFIKAGDSYFRPRDKDAPIKTLVLAGKLKDPVRVHEKAMDDYQGRFGPEGGACLMSASYDRTVRCWDLRARSTYPMQVLSGAADSVSALAVGEHEIVAGSIDGTVVTFDLRRGEALRDSLGPPVGHVALSNDQNCLLCSTLDSTLRLLDKASGTVLCEYKGHENSAFKMGCTLSTDDSRVLCGSEKGHLHAWDLVEGRQLLKHQAHSGPLVSLSCHPKQANSLLTASHDGTVQLWNAPGG